MQLKTRAAKLWKDFFRPFLVIIVILSSLRSAVADWNDVPTGSMKPTILEGDRILVNKLAYGLKVPFTTYHLVRWDRPERGDIVVFFSPIDGTRLVKRVVGLPGDVIQLRDNQLIINGSPAQYGPLDEDHIAALTRSDRAISEFASERVTGEVDAHPVMSMPGHPARRTFGPTRPIPEGYYFVLGDNRDNSADSRFIGLVHEDQIVGRSSRVALSLDYNHSYMPRWGRFLAELP